MTQRKEEKEEKREEKRRELHLSLKVRRNHAHT